MNANSVDKLPKCEPSAVQASKEALESELSLRLLSAIEGDQSVTQRSLALRFGVAVGLVNGYVKRCMRKGLVKAQQVPTKRYAYFLTPKGFAEKSRLIAEYLSNSLAFYRRARAQYAECLAICDAHGWTKVALVGDGDLAEIATLAAIDAQVKPVAVIAPGSNRESVVGLPAAGSLTEARDFDAVLLTDMENAQATYEALLYLLPDERILAPQLLRLTRHQPAHASGDAA
ncbi:MAG: winged helix-turn-helix transcriptional regulator [Alphaproteobacteria bacterium]|nr:winged helix-turn-helix transcriptional regulator [Alphaproteobacteria bacterium]